MNHKVSKDLWDRLLPQNGGNFDRNSTKSLCESLCKLKQTNKKMSIDTMQLQHSSRRYGWTEIIEEMLENI